MPLAFLPGLEEAVRARVRARFDLSEVTGQLEGTACMQALFVPRGADDEHVGRYSDVAIVRK